jgi:hypothetical protein
VKSLKRDFNDFGFAKISQSPTLYFGGVGERGIRGFPILRPEVASELAKYEGNLYFLGLRELPDASAEALSSFPGNYLFMFGPAAESFSPKAAAALAKVSGNLHIPLRELDSVPLAERFAKQIHWTLRKLETVSQEAAPALSRYKQFFDLRLLTVIDSPEMARRFVNGSTPGRGLYLPALTKLSPKTAEILASGSKSLNFGLTLFDSPEIARSLTKAKAGVKLLRLRAATPEVIEILKGASSVETAPLETIYILSK